MAGELIGALRVTLGLDSAQFESGSKKARATAKRDVNAIQAEFSKLKGLASNIAGIWAGSEIVAAGKRALDYASSLGEVAQQLGVTTKDLQSYRFAASQVGVSNEQMDAGLAKLTRSIGEAKAGSKAQATTFRELGVAVQDANGKVYTAGDVIPKLADALSKIKDPATRARLEVELFGKAGQKLDTLLSGGSEAVNSLRNAAQKLGIVLSDRQIQSADEAADKLSEVKQVLEANIAGTVADNARAILTLAGAFTTLTGQAIRFANEYPRISAALSGAAIGARFGPGGAVAGAAGGALIGDSISNANADQNMDLSYRRKVAKDAQFTLRRMRQRDKTGGGLLTFRRAGEGEQGNTLESARAEVIKQAGLLRAAVSAASRAKPSPSTIADGALPTVTPSGGGKPKGHTGPSASDRAENYQQELSNLAADQLSLQQNITSDVRERARLEHERINTQAAAYDFDLDTKVKANQLNAADAERLKLSNERNRVLQATAVNWQLDDDLTQQELELRRSSLQNEIEGLSSRSNLARTAEERRQIEMKILDAQFEIYRLELEAVKSKHSATDTDKQIAQAKLDQLSAVKGTAAASVNRQNAGPLGAYLDSTPRTAAETNEAFEQIAANGLANMNDQLAQAAANTLKLKGFAGQLFNQLIADMIKLNLQQAMGSGGGLFGGLLKTGTSLLGGGALSGGLSKAYSNIDSLSSGVGSIRLPGLATGGRIGGFGGTDNNVLSINGVPRARVSANERISVEPNAADRVGGGGIATIVPSEYFDVVVDRRSAAIAAPMATKAAMGGSAMAQSSVARKGRRRIPGA